MRVAFLDPCYWPGRYLYQDEATIMVNMSAEDLQKKYNGNLNSEMTGPLHNLIAKVGAATNHLSCGCVRFHIYFILEIELSTSYLFAPRTYQCCNETLYLVGDLDKMFTVLLDVRPAYQWSSALG